MDSIAKYYINLSEQLQKQQSKLISAIQLLEATPQRSYRLDDGSYVDEEGNPVGPAPEQTAPQNLSRSYRLDDGSYVDEEGNPVGPATPATPGVDVEGPPSPAIPATPGVDVEGPPSPSNTPEPNKEKEDYAAQRKSYYAKRNEKARQEAEENLARMGTLDPSKMSAHGKATLAVNRLRAQRAMKGDKFSQEDIDRIVASDTKERFMTPEEKAARAERTRAGVAALTAEAEKRYGPGGGVRTIDRRGDNLIQGTNMSYNQFREIHGREYNALSNDDANLARGAASNWASARVSPLAQETAKTTDAFNRRYAAQNTDLARRQGAADRVVDQSQFELDRFRNDPQYRQQKVSEIQAQPGFVKGIADEMADKLFKAGDRRYDSVENIRSRAAAERLPKPRKPQTPDLLRATPEVTEKTPSLLSRDANMPVTPELLQTPTPEPGPSYAGVGGKNYAQPPSTLERPEETPPDLLSRPNSAPRSRTVGGDVTQRAQTLNTTAASPAGTVSPTLQPPRVPLGTTVTPASRPQQLGQPLVATAGQPVDAQQTGGPREQDRAIPSPTQNPFQIKKPTGSAVTRAASTFRSSGRVA